MSNSIKNKINNLNIAMIYGIISICIVMFIAIFWCTQKNGMFLDEIYSYGLSNSYYEPFLTSIKQDDIVDTTFSKQELIDYLTVSKEDAFSYDSVFYNQTKDVHPPLFYVILHTVSSIFLNSHSKWLGLGLNLIYYFITIVFIYRISKYLFRNQYIPGTMVILYGCTSFALFDVIFIRMYMLSTMFTVILAFLILQVLKKDSWVYYVLMCFVTCAGLLTHYFFVFYAFFISAFLVIYLLIKKDYIKAIKSSIFLILGVILFVIIFPHCLQHITAKTGTGFTTAEYISSFDFYRLYIVARSFASVNKIPVFIGLILFIYLVFNHRNTLNIIGSNKSFVFKFIILIMPAILSLFAITLVSYNYRYLLNISPFFIIIVGCFIEVFLFSIKNKHLKKFSIVTIVVISIGFSLVFKPYGLYSEYVEYDQIVNRHNNYSCVYITANRNPSITQDLPQLIYFDNVVVIEDVDSPYFLSNIKTFQEKDGLVVYFASYPTPLYDKKSVNKIQEKTGFSSVNYLYNNGWSEVYEFIK